MIHGFNMADSSPLQPLVIPPGSGKTWSAFGDEVTVLLDGQQTGGAFSCALIVTPPGGGPPLHYHTVEDEWFLVQEGEVEFTVNGRTLRGEAGTLAYLPKGSHHTFRNIGDQPLRMLLHTAPSGFEVFFERIAEVFHAPGGPDMPRIIAISAEHGIFYPDAEGRD